MKYQLLLAICVGASLGSLRSFTPLAGEAVPAAPPAPTSKSIPPESSGPELQLVTMLRHSVPGEHHVLLSRLVGEWTTRTRYWMKPGTEPVEATGRCTRRWILDGRFVLEELDGGDLGLPFRAVGIFGYDAFEQKYTSAWVDTTSTAILTNLGTYDATNSVVSFAGLYKDPWTGARKPNRGLMRFAAADKVALELHVTEPGGPEYKMLEITYTRIAGDASPSRQTP